MHQASSIGPVLRAALPRLSFRARALLDAMILAGGSIGSGPRVAKLLGFGSRFDLARALAKEGLPTFGRLAAWITILVWTWNWEHRHVALGPTAISSGRDPSVCYRLVRRITKRSWTTVRELGTRWVLENLLEECCYRGEYTRAPRRTSKANWLDSASTINGRASNVDPVLKKRAAGSPPPP